MGTIEVGPAKWTVVPYNDPSQYELFLTLCTGVVVTPNRRQLPENPGETSILIAHAGPFASERTLGLTLPHFPHFSSIVEHTPQGEISLDDVVNWYKTELSRYTNGDPSLISRVFFGMTSGLLFPQPYGTFFKIKTYFNIQRNDSKLEELEHERALRVIVSPSDRIINVHPYRKGETPKPIKYEI